MRLMVLGGGSSQLTTFRRARELGYTTVLADHNPDAPARGVADLFVEASTFDVAGVVRGAIDMEVDAILAVGTDQPVYTAAAASAEIGLPFPLSVDQALSVTNKRVMKRFFSEYGIPTARWSLLSPPLERWNRDGGRTPIGQPWVGKTEAGQPVREQSVNGQSGDGHASRLRPPYVVKPVDSQGQRGIVLAADRESVIAHYPEAIRFSREESVLVEEYIPSKEVTVSGWADERGGVTIWAITDRVTLENPPGLGVCLAHRYPSYHAGRFEARIRDLTREIVDAFGLSGGPIYFQMLVTEETVVVNEIAFRLGGAYEDQSLPPVCGVDVLRRQLLTVGGRPGGDPSEYSWPQRPAQGATQRPVQRPVRRATRNASHMAVPLIFAEPGTVARLEGDASLRALPGVTDCRFLLPVGTTIRPMKNSTQRIAYAVLHGNSVAEINSLVDTTFDTLRVIDEGGNNILMDTRDAVKHPTR